MSHTSKRTPGLAAACLLLLAGCTKEKVCPADQALCHDTCTSFATDAASCGACDHACTAGQVCTAGLCEFGTAQNCGALGRTCQTGERCVSGGCVADLYLACFNTGDVREATSDLAAAGVPTATAAGPVGLAWSGESLFVANSISGTVDVLRFDPPGVRKEGSIVVPSGDVGFSDLEFITAANGLLYVSNAAATVLDVIDAASLRIVDEIRLGNGSLNPQGIAVVGAKAYVALNASSEVLVVDVSPSATCGAPPCGTVSKRIALPDALATGPNGKPMPARLAVLGGKIYVTLWNLDPGTFSPAGSGRLAVIDAATDALVTAAGSHPVDLGADCENPADIAVSGQVLYVTCGFAPFDAPAHITGAGIVAVDVSSGAPTVRTAIALSSNNAGAIALCGPVAYVGDRASGAVLRYDPARSAITANQTLCPPPAPGSAAFVAALACGR
jgi:hypothetical protein